MLSYQYTLYTVCTHATLCTHLYIVICEGATDYTLYNRLVVQQIVVQRCNRLYICNVMDVHCMVSSVEMVRYHNFGFGTVPECNTSLSILNRYHR